jgi:hypothetical protein
MKGELLPRDAISISVLKTLQLAVNDWAIKQFAFQTLNKYLPTL